MQKYNSCLNCKRRNIGCHTNCEDYKIYREQLDHIKMEKRKIKEQYQTHIRRKYK